MNSGPATKIYKRGEEILTEVAEPVTPEEFVSGKLAEIVEQLETMAREVRAVGFAAPQIGHSKRVMTIGMEFDNPRRPNVKQFPNMTFVNPEITYASPETSDDWEGCASIDAIIALVSRHVTIRYKAQDPKGTPIEGELNNFAARVFQHEFDHLNGILMDTKAIETKDCALIDKTTVVSMKP